MNSSGYDYRSERISQWLVLHCGHSCMSQGVNNSPIRQGASKFHAVALWLMCLFFSCFSQSAFADITIESIDSPLNLNPFIRYISDCSQSLSFETVLEDDVDLEWLALEDNYLISRGKDCTTWFKVTLKMSESAVGEYPVLYIPNQASLVSDLTIRISDSNHTKLFETGASKPFYSRDIASLQYAFELPVSQGEISIVGRVKQGDVAHPTLIPLCILSQKSYQKEKDFSAQLLTGFYAIMFALLFYNLIFYSLTHHDVYGYYCLFLFFSILECGFMDGNSAYWIFTDSPLVNTRINNCNVLLSVFAYLLFVKEALFNFRNMPRLFKIYKLIINSGGVALLFNIFSPSLFWANVVSQIYPSIAILFSSAAIVMAIKNREKIGVYLLAAELGLLTGVTLFLLMMHGYIELNAWSMWYLHVGIIIEALMLSCVIAARTLSAEEGKAQTEAKMVVQRKLLASLSHEFRTPLNAILGYGQILQRTSLTDRQSQGVDQIVDGGKHLTQLVDHVLDLSLLEADKVLIRPERMHLSTAIEDCIALNQDAMDKKNIVFSSNLDSCKDVHLFADPVSFRQVVINLISNAIKYNKQGGDLSIQIKPNHFQCIISVTDTGNGIARENHHDVFEPFERLGNEKSAILVSELVLPFLRN